MARTIDSHAAHGYRAPAPVVSIFASEMLGPGGAPNQYLIEWDDGALNHLPPSVNIQFQNGGIKEVGINGITHEALLAIIADRLEHFQAGPYQCEENSRALWHVSQALYWLNKRTQDREARGVEGTQKP